jgi:hypothetical protein
MKSLDPRDLYRIAGKQGPMLQRIKEAMNWLLSPKAEGIGEKLLKDAYALHGKPVRIGPGVAGERYSYYLRDLHEIKISLEITHSLERTLAHELVHAGQNNDLNFDIEPLINFVVKPMNWASREVMKYLSEEIKQVKDYHTAYEKLEFLVHHVTVSPYREHYIEIQNIMRNHPEYERFIQEVENPALEVQNRVARIRNEPQKESYILSPEQTAQYHIDTCPYLKGKERLALPSSERTTNFHAQIAQRRQDAKNTLGRNS